MCTSKLRRLIAKLAHFGWTELEPQRSERIGLHEKFTRGRVEHLVVACRFFNERGFRRIRVVEGHRRRVLSEPQIAVEPCRELRKICGDVGIELVGQHPVKHHACRDQQHAEHGGVDEGQSRTQCKCHGGASVSMYPTPRTVWISGAAKPLSTLFLNELMCTSTTLLTLSKWMSHTCSMMSDFVSGRPLFRIRYSSSEYSFGLRSIRRPSRRTRACEGVQLEVGDAKNVFARGSAAEHGAQARRELGQRERLHHVVVGSAVEPGDTVFDRILRRQNQDGKRRLSGPDVTEDLKPRAARQHQVENHCVVIDRAGLLAGRARRHAAHRRHTLPAPGRSA